MRLIMNNFIIFHSSSKSNDSSYDPWEKMDQAIEDYRKNEEAGILVFASGKKQVIEIKPEPSKPS